MARYLWIFAITVGVFASASVAAPDFSMPSYLEMTPGSSSQIPIYAMGVATVGGMDLFLEVDSPLEIASLDLYDDTIWGPAPPVIVDPPIYPDSQHASAFITTVTAVTTPGKVAVATLYAPADIPLGTTLTARTWWPNEQSRFLLAEPLDAAQASMVIQIVPEPTAFLLLAMGTMLARRRRRSA